MARPASKGRRPRAHSGNQGTNRSGAAKRSPSTTGAVGSAGPLRWWRSRGSLLGAGIALVVAIALAGVFVVSSRGRQGGATGTALQAGRQAPAFALDSTAGRSVTLAEFQGKKNVLLYWYEHAG